MKYNDVYEIIEQLSVFSNKFYIYISICSEYIYDICNSKKLDPVSELKKAIPFLTISQAFNFYFKECKVLEFETEEDMLNCYDQIVGDDGPTKLNSYNGPVKVYALTIYKGKLMNENT